MLSIGKIRAGQEAYYSRQVAAGRDDYYAGRGEAPGEWSGRGAGALGLEGEVDSDDFRALMGAIDPNSGTELVDGRGGSSVAAFDLTFSAPKSVSVLYAVGDPGTSHALRDAHDEAVREALSYLEREACVVRRGAGGQRRLRAEGFTSAAYRHRMSRATDPQLHTHVVTANLARGSDGRYSRLDGRALYAHARAAGYLYEAHLRHAARERLPWVRWTEPHKGIAEIQGVPSAVLREFSQRRQEIEAWLAERGKDPSDRRAAERAALNTRGPKAAGIETAPWSEAARARAAEHGLGREELAALGRQGPHPHGRLDERALGDELAGPAGLTERESTFRARDAVIAFAGAAREGSPRADVEARARGFLGRRDVICLPAAEPRYTTTELLQREEAILAGVERRGGEGTAALRRDAIERALARSPIPMTGEQRAAALWVGTSPDGVAAIEALAGTGKTTLAGVLRNAYERCGYRVVGAAPTARAARELRERAGIAASGTLARLRGDLERGDGFGSQPTVLIVDEAGMASTREAAVVLEAAERDRVKVVAIGDSGQLASVGAGGWFGSLARENGSARLTDVVRQRDRAERRALALVHEGSPRPYLELKQRRGELHLHRGAGEAEAELVERWWQRARSLPDGEAVMIARRNEQRATLNEAARNRLRDAGVLGEAVDVGEREFAVGERVIARRNDPGHDLDNGMRATVRAIDPQSGELMVETDSAGPRRLPAAYVAEHLEYAYALTGHGMQGATVEWAGVIGRPEDYTRNWSYTALSRAREPTEVRVVASESATERERAEIAPAERFDRAQPLEHLERSMRSLEEPGLAREYLEPAPLPSARARDTHAVVQEAGAAAAPTPLAAQTTDELRAELRPLDADVAQQRRLHNELKEARLEADRASAAVRGTRERVADLSAGGGRWGRDPEPWVLASERVRLEAWEERSTVVTERVRSLEGALMRRGADRPLAQRRGERAKAIRSELDRRREAHLETALVSPRAHVTKVLGRCPTDARGRAAWERGVRAIERYRFDYDVRGRDALGPKPREVEARDAWLAARRVADDAQRRLGRQVERGIEWVR